MGFLKKLLKKVNNVIKNCYDASSTRSQPARLRDMGLVTPTKAAQPCCCVPFLLLPYRSLHQQKMMLHPLMTQLPLNQHSNSVDALPTAMSCYRDRNPTCRSKCPAMEEGCRQTRQHWRRHVLLLECRLACMPCWWQWP